MKLLGRILGLQNDSQIVTVFRHDPPMGKPSRVVPEPRREPSFDIPPRTPGERRVDAVRYLAAARCHATNMLWEDPMDKCLLRAGTCDGCLRWAAEQLRTEGPQR